VARSSGADVVLNLINAVRELTAVSDDYWSEKLKSFGNHDGPDFSIHLGIFSEPFLSALLAGVKRVDARFSTYKRAPYQSVQAGDVLLVKRVAGPIVAVCEIDAVWYYFMPHGLHRKFREQFSGVLHAHGEHFWKNVTQTKYVTLMSLNHLAVTEPLDISKRDRQGWVVIQQRGRQLELPTCPTE